MIRRTAGPSLAIIRERDAVHTTYRVEADGVLVGRVVCPTVPSGRRKEWHAEDPEGRTLRAMLPTRAAAVRVLEARAGRAGAR